MDFEQLAECLEPPGGVQTTLALRDTLPADAPADWRNLAALLALDLDHRGPHGSPVVLGISGGQGAGKTTLSDLLVRALAACGRRGVAMSLDDFYLTRAERQRLARTVHPLLATRGVPGTHDVALALEILDGIREGRPVPVPSFDKATDDRLPAERSRPIEPGVDVVIFEGWCVGAPPQPDAALTDPVNELERREDADGRWRRFVNGALAADYPPLWRRLDVLLYLAVPDMAAVRRWRAGQEQQHPPARRMSPAAIDRFVDHYERLTRWMLTVLPDTADMVGLLDENHALAGFRRRSG
ncbi:MAG: hypothetical protein AB7I04_03490 [Pseudomonadales bacterium]